ncbi:aldo/keto reductase [Kibdelosporangium lantanae]|uniref:Aldo/keto reductase n=1 Tax=Kibdelosporangium lantanae TaxID=1497396 RepID=A0ABW3MAA8_9PSEU
MRYIRLGSTGMRVSRVCLGMMSYGDSATRAWHLDEEAAEPIVRAAVDAGVTFFDTADMYSVGASEEITGRLLARLFPKRDDYVLATKVYFPMGEGPNDKGLSRKHIMASIDDSLRRLGTDHVDLYQIHRFDYDTPLDETMEALNDVVRAGKARYIGASSMYAWQFAKAQRIAERNGWARFVSMQNHYNLIYREEEREMIPLCQDEGVGVIPWSPLARGRLARSGQTVRATSDPILDTSDPQKLNPYSYAANNPTSMSDSTGLTMRIDDGVEMAEYYKTVQSRQTAGYSTAPPKRNQRTRDARNAYFGKPAPGAKRVIVRTHFFFPDDQGILVFRFFIHGHDHLGLLGDDRGFTSDLDVGYRYVVALDTWSGEMSVTFSPSATTEKHIRNHSTGMDVDVPVQHYPARDIGNDEQDRNKNAVMVNTDTPGKLSIGYSGMNSVLPCCQVQGKITLEKEQGGTRATVKGEKFPDLEVIQYRNEGARDVGKDDMSWMQELATVGSQWGARDSTWHIPNK